MPLRWRLTWPDQPEDGRGSDPAFPLMFARVYRQVRSSSAAPWYWTVSDTHHVATGFAATKDAAKAAAEAAWARYIAGLPRR